jgi:DNA-binding transcriptional ArsR family regulator
MYNTLNLDAIFSALADPTRRAILARLAKGEATVLELAEPFEMTQPAVSQHLKVLEEAGLVVRRVEGAKRPRRLAKAGIEAIDRWLAMLRKALAKNYDRLDEVLASMEQPKMRKTMSKLALKTEGDTHVVVTRRFAAPPEAVYRAHTDPKLIQKSLLGSGGWKMPVRINETKPGGKIRY